MIRKIAAVSALVGSVVVCASSATASTVINNNYVCGINSSYPMHAQSIVGYFDHFHKIKYSTSSGTTVTSTKSIWPTGLSNAVGTVGQQTSYAHLGTNGNQGAGGSGSVYCRNANNA